MGENEWITIRRSFRSAPTRMALFVVGPLLLAIAQLVNAAVTGLPLWAAGAFATAMVTYAVLFARLHASQLKLERLEATAAPDDHGTSS